MLSKSKIMAGLQCPKRLWLEVHRPQLAELSEDTEHRFAVGHLVNDVACSLHPEGILVEMNGGIHAALEKTQNLLNETAKQTLFEATFTYQDVVVRTDILKTAQSKTHLIEVKSSTAVKDNHYADCAVQAWVLEGAGFAIDRVELAHIDNQFTYPGGGDYQGLFHYADLTEQVLAEKGAVTNWVETAQATLADEEPDIATGPHCTTPYRCPFITYCYDEETAYPVRCLPRGGKIATELEAEGITDIREIPPGRLTNPVHAWVRDVTVKGEADLRDGAAAEFEDLGWPRYYLDFETVSFAVPIWPGTRPYETIASQWSCHIEDATGGLQHEEFIDISGDFPERAFVESLLETVGKEGPIFIYSSYENTCLDRIAARYDDLGPAIAAVQARLFDLHQVTRQYYYHPEMRGSWSLKAIVPTLADLPGYDELGEVRDGGAAVTAYQVLIHPDTNEVRRNKLKQDLLTYCRHDTLALVELVRLLENKGAT